MTRSDRRGFTLIELLAVIMVIGVLASIAIPKFSRAKDRAYTGTLMSDLRNLATAQERFFVDSQTYAPDTDALGVRPSTKVTISISNVTGNGWQATATHANFSGKCEVFVGNRVNGSKKDGVPVCS